MHTNCPECGHSVSTWTVRCPGCDRRLQIHPLLKYLGLLALLGAFVGWETRTATDAEGDSQTLSRRVVLPLYGPLPGLEQQLTDEPQPEDYEKIAVERAYGYGLYRDEFILRR